MPEELQRVHNKINYETNVVDPKTFAILLEAVRKNQPLSYENGRDNIFPNARASAGMQWNVSKVDTHASGTLEQYCLVNATEDRTITVSDLGYKFLSCFDENYNVKVYENYYKTVLLEMIFSWVELNHGRSIHPGRMLFKLMLDDELGGYHTNNEFALWTSNECAMMDSDYDKIKQLILEYRANPREVKQKKAEVFLRPFANSWGLFDRIIDGDTYTFTIKKEILPLVKQFFIYIDKTKTYKLDNDDNYKVYESKRVKGGANILLYGVPGCGKSHTIKNEYCNDSDRMERIVFHPDYTYSDFVGQILPKVVNEKITYEYVPGPFTKLLAKAYNNPEIEYFLIIEEINRGNAPAIFGEVFQLLDRDCEGNSEYGISNSDIASIVYNNTEHLVSMPSNLNILATMNTSDQNVFTLDTAFQRRWCMKLIKNDVNSAEHANNEILDTGVKWKVFNTIINNHILENSIGISSAEDKRLGAYFVGASDLIFNENGDNDRFPEKVLKYLWDDAFKFSRSSIFVDDYHSLEEIVIKFKSSTGIDRFNIFKEEIIEQFIS